VYVCLSVCRTRIQGKPRPNYCHQIFRTTRCRWPLLGKPLAVLQYVITSGFVNDVILTRIGPMLLLSKKWMAQQRFLACNLNFRQGILCKLLKMLNFCDEMCFKLFSAPISYIIHHEFSQYYYEFAESK